MEKHGRSAGDAMMTEEEQTRVLNDLRDVTNAIYEDLEKGVTKSSSQTQFQSACVELATTIHDIAHTRDVKIAALAAHVIKLQGMLSAKEKHSDPRTAPPITFP